MLSKLQKPLSIQTFQTKKSNEIMNSSNTQEQLLTLDQTNKIKVNKKMPSIQRSKVPVCDTFLSQ